MLNNKGFLLLILAAVCALVYWPSLSGEFLGDDYLRIVEASPHHLQGFWNFLKKTMPDRPLLMFSVYINYFISELEPWSFKLVNMLAHTFVAALFFWLLPKLIPQLTKRLALVLTLIFLVHPLNTQAVNVVIQRGVLFSTMFLLLSMHLLLHSQSKSKSGEAKLSLALSCLAFFASLLFKPITFVYPLWIALYFYLKGEKRKMLLALWFILPLLFPLLVYSIGKTDRQDAFLETLSAAKYFGVQMRVWWVYFKLALFPHPLKYMHPLNIHPPQNFPFLYFFLHLVLATLSFWLLRKNKVAVLFLASIYLFLIPESSIFPIRDVIFEHRAYLPLLFFIGLLASVLPSRKRLLPFFLCVPLVIFSWLSFERNEHMASLLRFQQDIYREHKGPHTHNMHYVLNLLYTENFEEGREVVKELRELKPEERDYVIVYDLFFYSTYSLEQKGQVLEKIANTLIQTQKYTIHERMRRMLNEFVFIRLRELVDEKTFNKKIEALYRPQKEIFKKMGYSPPTFPSPRGSLTP